MLGRLQQIPRQPLHMRADLGRAVERSRLRLAVTSAEVEATDVQSAYALRAGRNVEAKERISARAAPIWSRRVKR